MGVGWEERWGWGGRRVALVDNGATCHSHMLDSCFMGCEGKTEGSEVLISTPPLNGGTTYPVKKNIGISISVFIRRVPLSTCIRRRVGTLVLASARSGQAI